LSTEILRILVADDHPLFRNGMRSLLNAEPGFQVVGEAVNGEEAVRMAAELAPDVILMDVQMPGLNGLDATRKIVQANPEIKVLVVTMFEDDHTVFSALKAGARGYMLKGASPDDVLRAIRSVASGDAIFGPEVAVRLLDFFTTLRPAALPNPLPDLTEREREILDLIARGRSNSEIATTLFLSPKTVSNYVSSIFNKLQVADRAQAMLKAREAGLGQH